MQDLPALAPLAAALLKDQKLPFKTTGEKATPWFVNRYLRSPEGVCFIAEAEDKIVGWIGASIAPYAFSDEDLCQVAAWDVHPDYRGVGVGRVLLSKVMAWARLRGVNLVSVGVNADASSHPEAAYTALENVGFKEFERTYYIKVRDENSKEI
jgi:GNAT superfamily N-acetyltransferase